MSLLLALDRLVPQDMRATLDKRLMRQECTGPIVGAMSVESPVELKDSLRGQICDPFSETIKYKVGDQTLDLSPRLPISKSLHSHFCNSKTKWWLWPPLPCWGGHGWRSLRDGFVGGSACGQQLFPAQIPFVCEIPTNCRAGEARVPPLN